MSFSKTISFILNFYYSVAVVSCCYHKMSCQDDKFQNFPLSEKLRATLKKLNSTEMFSVYMLRLGSQENIIKWKSQTCEEHLHHMVNVFFRAVLEKVCCDNEVKLVKKKRRGISWSSFSDLDSFVDSVFENYDFRDLDIDKISSDIRNCHQENAKYSRLFENLTGLQFLLQSVIENLVILDRFHFLREKSDLSVCKAYEIFDPDISPRNKILFAKK